MFGNDRAGLRAQYATAWQKARAGEALSPLETALASLVEEHPEYQSLFEGSGEALAQPAVSSVIAGAMNTAQLESNIAAGQWRLGIDEVAELDTLLGPVVPHWQSEPDLTYFR